MEDSLPIAETADQQHTLAPEHSGTPSEPSLPADLMVTPPSLTATGISPALNTDKLATLGPWYHTLGIVLLLLLYAFVAHLTHHAGSSAADGSATSGVEQVARDAARAITESPKIPLYLSTMMLSWLLLAAVVAGLYHRRTFFLSTLRLRFKSRWVDPALGLAIYLSFLTTLSMLVLLFTSVLLMRAHALQRKLPTGSAQTQPPSENHQNPSDEDTSDSDHATDLPDAKEKNEAKPLPVNAAQETKDVQKRVQHLLHFKHDAVAALAPHTVPELLLWICLSFTAGFCEEHIFRGYLLSQSLAALRRLAIPPWLAATLSVLATSVLFGSLHLYEGVGGAVIVGLLGAVLATMTLVLGNLRAVIIAHFLQDFIGGVVYYIAHLRHAV